MGLAIANETSAVHATPSRYEWCDALCGYPQLEICHRSQWDRKNTHSKLRLEYLCCRADEQEVISLIVECKKAIDAAWYWNFETARSMLTVKLTEKRLGFENARERLTDIEFKRWRLVGVSGEHLQSSNRERRTKECVCVPLLIEEEKNWKEEEGEKVDV